jgi:hypothetical protein
MLHLAARAPHRRPPLSSNVRQHRVPFVFRHHRCAAKAAKTRLRLQLVARTLRQQMFASF